MRKFTFVISLICLGMIGFSNTALAAKDEKTILHCGCVLDEYGVEGVGMVYHEVNIAGNSGGHKRHTVGTYDDCWTGVDEITEEWQRSGRDCEITNFDADIPQCSTLVPVPSEEDDCGDLVIDD